MDNNKPAITRKNYMDGLITHDEYYCGLADVIGRRAIERLIPAAVDEVRTALKTDPHLNNIPLCKWDREDPFVRAMAYGNLIEPITGSRGWSLSDTVCVLKAVAKRLAEQQEG